MRLLRGGPRLVSLVATIAIAQGTAGLVLLLFEREEEQANTFKTLPMLFTVTVSVGNRVLTGADVLVLIVVPIVCGSLAIYFKRSKFGVAVRAAAENGEAARLLGISVNRVSMFTWVVGSLLAALAGILVTQTRGSLDIGTLSTGFLVRALAAALVGGLTSLPGALAGGLVVGVAEAVLRQVTNDQPGVPETVMFVIVIAFLIFRPGGLFGQREETEDKVAFIPTLRELPVRLQGTMADRATRWIGIGLAIVASMFSLVTGSYTNGVFVTIVVFAIVGVSLTVLMGYSGQISLGHWGLVGVGAFALGNLYTRIGIPYLISLPLVVVVGMVVSLLIGLPALRIRGLYLAIATLAFNLAAEFFIFNSRLVGGGSAGIVVEPPKLGPFDLDDPSNRPMFFFSVVMLIIALVISRNVAKGRTGRGFFSLRENEKAAATFGIDLTRYRLLAFAISGGIAALAGAVFATYLGFVEPTTYGTAVSLTLVAMVMIGGLGSLNGAIFGALVVFGLPDLFEFDNRWIIPIGTGILLIVVITRARGGVAGLVQRIRHRMVESLDEMAQSSETPSEPATTAGG